MHPLATAPRRTPPAALLRPLLALTALLGGSAHAFDWQVDVTPAGELFPALQLSQPPRAGVGGIGGGDGLVSVHVRAAQGLPAQLRLQIETPGLRTPTSVEARPVAGATSIVLHPRLDWDVATLRELRSPRHQTLLATLTTDSGATEVRRVEVRLHALDDAPYYVREGSERVDLGWVFAAYVDPHDPAIAELLAMARSIDPAFDAAPGDRAADRRRVGAIWAALERHGVRYAGGDPALSRGPVVWSQRVRPPSASWRERRASCIDGSVLIASALERIGLRALIVLVPGHAFVGFRHDDGARGEFLETTLLGATSARAGASSATRFANALSAGRARWRRVAPRLDGHHAPDYALLDIGKARTYGIIALPTASGAGGHAHGE
jgi:hypothetical protein